jgi:hypothetical protein
MMQARSAVAATQSILSTVFPDKHSTLEKFVPAEGRFIELLEAPDLDQQARTRSPAVYNFEQALTDAKDEAYHQGQTRNDAAHLFLQRVLYRIYRLNLFWYDDLSRYANEGSAYLQTVRERIEGAWQIWEQSQFERIELDAADVPPALHGANLHLAL